MKKIFTLFSAVFLSAAAFAQIPNASFETWTTSGSGSYDTASGWSSANGTIDALIPGTYTCQKGTTSPADGLAYIKLTSKTIPPTTTVAPGIAVTGSLSVDIVGGTYNVVGGFPYATRSASLTGKWQHMGGSAADHGRILVFLSKWNSTTLRRDTVATADTTLTGMAMSWEDFTIPMKYKSSSLTPDTGMIVLLSSSTATPVAGSYLWVDKLAFAGTVPAGIASLNMQDATTTVFPNPATGSVNVYYHATTGKDMVISLVDITGKVMKTQNVRAIAGENSFAVGLKGVAQGMYFIQLADGNAVIQKKLVIE